MRIKNGRTHPSLPALTNRRTGVICFAVHIVLYRRCDNADCGSGPIRMPPYRKDIRRFRLYLTGNLKKCTACNHVRIGMEYRLLGEDIHRNVAQEAGYEYVTRNISRGSSYSAKGLPSSSTQAWPISSSSVFATPK